MNNIIGLLTTGLMYDMAKDHGAYMVVVEHRYYGESIPNGLVVKIWVNRGLFLKY